MERTLFDLDRQILQHNLYGVDLNAEALQICQLSLWIKIAARGKQLTSLDHTIREGNSVISDLAVYPKAFDWQAAFPEVFAQSGLSNATPVVCWAGAGRTGCCHAGNLPSAQAASPFNNQAQSSPAASFQPCAVKCRRPGMQQLQGKQVTVFRDHECCTAQPAPLERAAHAVEADGTARGDLGLEHSGRGHADGSARFGFP